MNMAHTDRIIWPFGFLDRRKIAFPHLKEKLTLLEKNKMKLTLLKKYQKLFTSPIFFFASVACTAILCSNNKRCLCGSKNSDRIGLKKYLMNRTTPFSVTFLVGMVVDFPLVREAIGFISKENKGRLLPKVRQDECITYSLRRFL